MLETNHSPTKSSLLLRFLARLGHLSSSLARNQLKFIANQLIKLIDLSFALTAFRFESTSTSTKRFAHHANDFVRIGRHRRHAVSVVERVASVWREKREERSR